MSAALDEWGSLTFDKHSVEFLIQHGADVDAVDSSGTSCLAKACSDCEMTELLLDHGATVTRDALIQTMKLRNADLLELLLRDVDPNLRGNPHKYPILFGSTGIGLDEQYPLHYLLDAESGPPGWASEPEREVHERMVQLLLDHGGLMCQLRRNHCPS